jgi:hypothetical protein
LGIFALASSPGAVIVGLITIVHLNYVPCLADLEDSISNEKLVFFFCLALYASPSF